MSSTSIDHFKDQVLSLIDEGAPLILIQTVDLHYLKTELLPHLDSLETHSHVHFHCDNGFTEPVHTPDRGSISAKQFLISCIEEDGDEDIFSDCFGSSAERLAKRLLTTRDMEDILVMHATTEKKSYLLSVVCPSDKIQSLSSNQSILETIASSTDREEKRTLIVLLEIKKEEDIKPFSNIGGIILTAPMPDDTALRLCLNSFLSTEGRGLSLEENERDRIISALRGSSITQANKLLYETYCRQGELTKHRIERMKAQIGFLDYQSTSGVITFIPTSDKDIVAGHERLKRWLRERNMIQEEKALEYGLHSPKGLVLTGPPGTGKTMGAKTCAYLLNRPLFRLDVDMLFRSLVGAGEELARKAFSEIDALGRVVILIDEIEKMIGTKGSQHESSVRLFGQFMSWLSERRSDAFVVCTTNTLQHLPVEFTRSGRFNEIFYVGLPSKKEREAILAHHLKDRKHTLNRADIESVAASTEQFSGAELEGIVQTALVRACLREGSVTVEDLKNAARESPPLAKRRPDDIYQYSQRGREMGISASEDGEKDINTVNAEQDDWMIMYQ